MTGAQSLVKWLGGVFFSAHKPGSAGAAAGRGMKNAEQGWGFAHC